jgi:isoleucyl-tRNA synthetase
MTSDSKYAATLNLPMTHFPMKADLVKHEPQQLAKWEKEKIYQVILKKNSGRPLFTLHDGPPYANGHIHYGHILNKVLKDIVVKYKNMTGWRTAFIPGWDCHGLPIEHQVEKERQGNDTKPDILGIRRACRDYAEKFVNIQREEFKRLGILADWETPYRTMDPGYEATVVRQFAQLVENGMVYRGKKPVYWSTACKTTIAEAEVEYRDHRSPSLFIKFTVVQDPSSVLPTSSGKRVHFVIWTTTPWTLPGNQAVGINANYTYVVLLVGEEIFLVAESRLEALRASLNFQEDRLINRIPGKKLEGIRLKHPFLDREVPVVAAGHVTLDMGTGIVHIAPGHGLEDYEVGLHYHLPITSPIDDEGRFTDDCGVSELIGQGVFSGNNSIIALLRKNHVLLKEEEIQHQYPYCWRSQTPLIFRATPQYFLALTKQDLKGRALEAIRHTQWVPPSGQERIYQTVSTRPDWCLSRQRAWGVPLMAFRCTQCDQALLDGGILRHLTALIEKEGSDVFFQKTATELLPANTSCPQCGGENWEKEPDILDVWFESGSSWAAILDHSPDLKFPADLYLEGNDQHRGWFHSSLFLAMANRKEPPYRCVLTHGFVVDGEGKKLAKSAGNYLPPENIFSHTGGEILRLWAASEDYRQDIRFSEEILERLTESYRKIRNTLRFLLGNLADFNPNLHTVPFAKRADLDRWVLGELHQRALEWREAYEGYHFHLLYQSFLQFCSIHLSSLYLDIIKDRLYLSKVDDPARRASQSSLFEIARGLLPYLAPILSFTAEEAWEYLPPWENKTSSVFLADLPEFPQSWEEKPLRDTIDKVLLIRQETQKALETAKLRSAIRNPLDAQIRLRAEGDWLKFLQAQDKHWSEYLQVSQAVVVYDLENPQFFSERIAGLQLEVRKAEGNKCERCRHFSMTVGRNAKHPTLCQRCGEIV